MNGYSLLERPVRVDEDSLTNVEPGAAAKQARELMERYVGLQPHEASNLSVLLYNADAADLPLAVVRELSGMQTETDFQCNVSVRHRDPAKLRRVYAELVTKTGDDPDLPVVSETSQNFMSKLRISVAPPWSTPPRANDGFQGLQRRVSPATSYREPRRWNGFPLTGPTSARPWSTLPSRW